MTPSEIYSARLTELAEQKRKLNKKKSRFGLLRFGNIALMIAMFYFLWSFGIFWVITSALILLAVFVRLVYRDLDNKAAIAHVDHLISINESETQALNGNYFQFKDGIQFLPKVHAYAADLDIFGSASLFQFLNRTNAEMGAAQLAEWLLYPATVTQIQKRQEAVKELSGKLNWMQELRAKGREAHIRQSTANRLQEWLKEPALFLAFKPWRWLRIVLPLISSGFFIAGVAGWIPIGYMYISLFVFASIAYQLNKVVAPVHNKLSGMVDEMDTLSASAVLIEKESFQSHLLMHLQKMYASPGTKASKHILQLKRILDRFDLRYNVVISAPLNILLLWNLQQVLALEQWKQEHKEKVNDWFEALGKFEALVSLATLHHNHPGWCFPEFREGYFFIQANGLGHPLINPEKRVDNFIDVEAAGKIMLVTGSNMAGKSTYLRSVGVNVVLAMAGGVVCASALMMSPVQLISSMRIADNLEESTSTFYAELKKLKAIIEKVNNGEAVFILLDEILRGTNSLDRHTGSAALIRQLIKKNAVAIIATHDVSLAEISNEFPGHILNFHFDVQVEKEELYFDYKLKPGICTSLNASILMKKIGIEL
ncbi:MAG: hypothetical protein JST81_09420 [Bacteroidetes bacterium]|nr:hypothetical protein [Bacteroidota bacterium]